MLMHTNVSHMFPFVRMRCPLMLASERLVSLRERRRDLSSLVALESGAFRLATSAV